MFIVLEKEKNISLHLDSQMISETESMTKRKQFTLFIPAGKEQHRLVVSIQKLYTNELGNMKENE